jgi:hypothetical protein
MLCREPWRNHIGAMLAALAGDSTNRPVILCLADWREALPLLEAVLWLLPPSARARTTFATYETDRYFFPSAEGVRPPDVLSAHQILFLCSAKDNVWNLYADDYQSTFAIFNFVGNRFSDLGLPSPFAEFALACVRQGQCAPLERRHGSWTASRAGG